MFSNDRNIENIARFVEETKDWFDLKVKYTRLSTVDKVVRIITALILAIVLTIIFVLFLLFLSVAASIFVGGLLDSQPLGFLCIGTIYLILLVFVISARHSLIEKPLVRFLMSIIAEDEYMESTQETQQATE